MGLTLAASCPRALGLGFIAPASRGWGLRFCCLGFGVEASGFTVKVDEVRGL